MAKQVVSYRKSSAFSESPEAIAVWLRLAEIAAERVKTKPYDRIAFRRLLTDLRSLTMEPPDRYRTNDHFWFTFFHEAAHIFLHGKKAVFIDGEEQTSAREEEEANAFAGDLLIPKQEYAAFVQQGAFFPETIEEFAERIGLHPGIVVGRLQHDGLIKYKWHNQLKEKIDAP